jgi:hypothetical protein
MAHDITYVPPKREHGGLVDGGRPQMQRRKNIIARAMQGQS